MHKVVFVERFEKRVERENHEFSVSRVSQKSLMCRIIVRRKEIEYSSHHITSLRRAMNHQEQLVHEFLKYDPTSAAFGEVPIVVVTADGVTVPLEANTVRSIDSMKISSNYKPKESFASLSAEYFLAKGYRVIYVHRKDSIYFPFTKALQLINGVNRSNEAAYIQSFAQTREQLELRLSNPNSPTVAYELVGLESQIMRSVTSHQASNKERLLLPLTYQTIHEYFDLLEMLFRVSEVFGPQFFFFLAASIPPYHVPRHLLSTHKIQSDDALELRLSKVHSPIPSFRERYGRYTFVVEVVERECSDVTLKQLSPCLEHISKNQCHISLLLSHFPTSVSEVDVIRDENLRNMNYREEDFKNSGRETVNQANVTACAFDKIPSNGPVNDVATMLDLVSRVNDQVLTYYQTYGEQNFCCRQSDGKTMIVTGFNSQLLRPNDASLAVRQDIRQYQHLCSTSLSRLSSECVYDTQDEEEVVREWKKRFLHRFSLMIAVTCFGLLSLGQAYFLPGK